MLKIRVIPTLLWKQHSLVKSKRFSEWRKVGHLVPSVKIYNSRNVDEIIFLDISDPGGNQIPDYNIVFADSFKSEQIIIQSIGRALRLHSDKKRALIFDLVDVYHHENFNNVLWKHFKEREKFYIKRKYPYKLIKVNI